MNVTVLQTCDNSEHLSMLEATSRTAREFCNRQGLAYERFVGIKRGLWPWHAVYNRIYMIKELLDEGYKGWVLYMDADAYVCDLDFPVADYLASHSNSAGIFARVHHSAPYWDVNSGVFFLNADHPLARRLVEDWIDGHESAFSRKEFLINRFPEMDIRLDDQGLLNEMLIANPDWQSALHYESLSLINSIEASFLRHHLRARTPNLEQRIKSIRREVDEIFSMDAKKALAPWWDLKVLLARLKLLN